MISEEILSMIEEIDAPVLEQPKPGVTLIRNHGEQEITGFQVNGKACFFKRFRTMTERRPFLLDSVSGKVFSISELEWALLDELPLYTEEELVQRHTGTATAEEVRAAAGRLHDILQSISGLKFELAPIPDHDLALDQGLIRTLLLNTTEQCNIRCTYCYYSGNYETNRVHNSSRLGIDTAKAAIDRFLEHHHLINGALRAIYFFGGEPLLNFEMIRQVILYVKEVAAKRQLAIGNIIYQVNTNAMLLNEEQATFFAEHGVLLNISIDGPNHDAYRVDTRGNGTLDRVTERVEWLWRSYPEYFGTCVSLSCTVTPPYDLHTLYEYFVNYGPAQDATHIALDLVLQGGDEVETFKDFEALEKAKALAWEIFVKSHELTHDQRQRSWKYFFVSGIGVVHRPFWKVLWRSRRPVKDGRIENINGLNSLPGLFVTALRADGTYYATFQHQSEAYEIGNAFDGFNKARVYEVIKNFRDMNSRGACGTCWAARMCQVDYPDSYISDLDTPTTVREKLANKKGRCAAERYDLTAALSAVESIKETYGPAALRYLLDEREALVQGGEQLGWLPVSQESEATRKRRQELGLVSLG